MKVTSVFLDLRLLTRRELEVLFFLIKGLPNEKIAKKMKISHQSVKSHCCNIYKKLRSASRDQLMSKIIMMKDAEKEVLFRYFSGE